MAEVGFYIDTGAREDDVEEEEEDEETKDSEDEGRVLGSRDAAVEKQQRERAAKERNLASFLFGKTTDDAKEIRDDEAESVEEEDEDESDLEDNEAHQKKYLDKNSQRIPGNFKAQLEVHPKHGIKDFINNKAKTRPLLPG